jgi:hypothetical protein
MKKSFSILTALIFALSLIFIAATTVYAMDVNEPVVVPSVKGATFTSESLDFSALAGAHISASGKFEPVGLLPGETQFGSKGLKISGLAENVSASLCFPFSAYNSKWTGVIAKWNGVKWVKLDTVITPGTNGGNPTACVKPIGNGIYSMITWYIGPPEYPSYVPTVVPTDTDFPADPGVW